MDTDQDDVAKTTRRKEQVDPVLDLGDLDVEAWRDDTGLVQPSIELDNNLS
jgi:hypothetical protein